MGDVDWVDGLVKNNGVMGLVHRGVLLVSLHLTEVMAGWSDMIPTMNSSKILCQIYIAQAPGQPRAYLV